MTNGVGSYNCARHNDEWHQFRKGIFTVWAHKVYPNPDEWTGLWCFRDREGKPYVAHGPWHEEIHEGGTNEQPT